MNKSLIEIIKNKVDNKRFKYNRTEWEFWPSEASCTKPDGTIIGKCLRQLYYSWKGIPETNPIPDRVKLLGKIGNFVEYETRKELVNKKVYSLEANKKKQRKFKVNLVDDIILSGEVDIIATYMDETCGIEVKNYSNSTYQLLNKPKEPHLLQAFIYLIYYKPQQPYFLIKYMPSMVSKYATKEVYHRLDFIDIENETYPVVNGGIIKDIKLSSIVRRYKEAKYYIKNNILPTKDFKLSAKNCQQCVFKDYCKKDKVGNEIKNY